MTITPIPNRHEALSDIRGSRGLHAFGMMPIGSTGLSTPASSFTTLALTQGREYGIPIYAPRRGNWQIVRVNVTGAGTAGAVVRLGLREHNSFGGSPGDLMEDWGTLAVDSTGEKFLDMPDLDLPEGIYWLDLAAQGAPITHATLTAITGVLPFSLFQISTPGSLVNVGYRSGSDTITGALPALFGGGSASADGLPKPRIVLQGAGGPF